MNQRVIFEFIGGCMDGKRICNYEGSECEIQEAEGYLWVADGGKVGSRFMVSSPAAMQLLAEGQAKEARGLGLGFRKYEVFERLENGNELWIRARNVAN
jgi:hypothetical protein